MLDERIEKIEVGEQYLNALFAGVISVEGNTIMYHREECGTTTDVVLSRMGPEFPYGRVALFQGVKSFGALDEALRSEIAKQADERLNSAAPEVAAAGEMLSSFLSERRTDAYTTLAGLYENRDEIVRFLREASEAFRTYCLFYLR